MRGQGIRPEDLIMKIMVSNVCRVSDEKLIAYIQDNYEGGAPLAIPADVLAPRQVVINTGVEFSCKLKEHRGQSIPVVNPAVAAELVRDGVAAYEPQSALLYSMEAYLSDADVQADEAELARAKASEADYVFVAVIGGSRSALAVCRNIVSGCQKPETLESDAEKALKASNVFLIEE